MAKRLRYEAVSNGHVWWRIANLDWEDPLDPDHARRKGGRWNPPNSYRTLYLNSSKKTAHCNLRAFIAEWPYEPEDLRDDNGPVLIGCRLPRNQVVCDAHTSEGIKAAGLPSTYPVDSTGKTVPHLQCQNIGRRVKDERKRGVHARSAQSIDAINLELAWFPASTRSVARPVERLLYGAWYWHS